MGKHNKKSRLRKELVLASDYRNKRGYRENKKGIDEKYIKLSISKIKENAADPDFFSAIKICKKRRIGPCREEGNRPLYQKKDISILARSGFNYDGSKKSKTKICDNVFVGSNSSLVAPIHIEKNSIIGAGSVITENVRKYSLAITRSSQFEVKNYRRKRKK